MFGKYNKKHLVMMHSNWEYIMVWSASTQEWERVEADENITAILNSFFDEHNYEFICSYYSGLAVMHLVAMDEIEFPV